MIAGGIDYDRRLRDVIRNAEPTTGSAFAHWFPNGWFVLVRKSKVILCHSVSYTSEPGRFRPILEGPRNGATYADFAAAMGFDQ